MIDSTTPARTAFADEEAEPSVGATLEKLARTYLRSAASPLPRNPATLGWQATAGPLAALAAVLLDYVNKVNPEHAAGFTRTFFHGDLGDGPHPAAVGWWIQTQVADRAGADVMEWMAAAEQDAQAALVHMSRPTGLEELGLLLGDDVIATLISGLDASWKEWAGARGTWLDCFLPGCPQKVDISGGWTVQGGASQQGWRSASAVGFACPEHASLLWAGAHQHTPMWNLTGDTFTTLDCSCGWTSGTVTFRAHGTTLYQAHALELLRALA
ncbi:hypothetical protein [Streptomyces filamentosus]|uniref:hypothetical protein n=1 Tax=Streptomyces filamentosus TaxID=67294 RepID=UPI0033C73048